MWNICALPIYEPKYTQNTKQTDYKQTCLVGGM